MLVRARRAGHAGRTTLERVVGAWRDSRVKMRAWAQWTAQHVRRHGGAELHGRLAHVARVGQRAREVLCSVRAFAQWRSAYRAGLLIFYNLLPDSSVESWG